MKKNYFFLVFTLIVTMFIALIIFPAKASNIKNSNFKDISPLPEEVAQIFNTSCMGCHWESGNEMALAHVNFSNWADYSPKKQASKASNICDEISSGGMPPKSFKKQKPDLIPTEVQIKIICDWSASLNKKN
jgi:hypothetical protein